MLWREGEPGQDNVRGTTGVKLRAHSVYRITDEFLLGSGGTDFHLQLLPIKFEVKNTRCQSPAVLHSASESPSPTLGRQPHYRTLYVLTLFGCIK